MTVKKKETGELQEVRANWTTAGFRWAIVILVASMHPVGRTMLAQMGFIFPDQLSEKRNAEEVIQVKTDVASVKKDVADLKQDVASVKGQVTSVKDDVQRNTQSIDTFARTFTGLQVDFERFKQGHK